MLQLVTNLSSIVWGQLLYNSCFWASCKLKQKLYSTLITLRVLIKKTYWTEICFKVIFLLLFQLECPKCTGLCNIKSLYFSQKDYTNISTLKGNLGLNMHMYIHLHAYISIRIFTCIICTLKTHSSLLLWRKTKCSKFNYTYRTVSIKRLRCQKTSRAKITRRYMYTNNSLTTFQNECPKFCFHIGRPFSGFWVRGNAITCNIQVNNLWHF